MPQLTARILIVDDEDGIRKTLQAILEDEGYSCVSASNGADALAEIQQQLPDLVLLDIWMPGMDGMEVLQTIKLAHPNLPVIMISGHASIQTAVQATRLGASDFIEKPLELNNTLAVIQRVLRNDQGQSGVQPNDVGMQPISPDKKDKLLANLAPLVFTKQLMRGQRVPQKTITRSSIMYGLGVHTGQKSGLVLETLPANSGIHFIGVVSDYPVPAHLDYVTSTGFATTLKGSTFSVSTVEHLMSALNAYGIANALIKCNGEVPVMDGSALEFCKTIEQVGLQEQEGDWFEIEVRSPIKIGSGKEFIELLPADNFSVEYLLQYPAPLGRQEYTFVLDSPESYKQQIAPARTFGFVRDINALQQKGLAQGGRFDNFVLYDDTGPVNVELRFENEAVRHKILDAIGDLYLLGRPIRGKVRASMTGHSDNIALLKALKERMQDELK